MTNSLQSRTVDLERPVFIIGVGRSGTSLLQSMLNAHPELAFTPETHFFRRYVADDIARAHLENAGAKVFAEQLALDTDFARAEVSIESLLTGSAPLDLLEVFRQLLGSCATGEGKHRVGDKDPRNIDYLPALARAFPAGYVLHVIRDPRDVLLSRTKAAWSATRPWWSHPLIYREQLRRGRQLGAELFGERYLEVRYEALISDAESALREVCELVELDWSPAMLDFGASAAKLVDPRELSWKKETLGPLLSGNAGKWREGLSDVQVRYTEQVCAEAFDELGYERSNEPSLVMNSLAPILRAAASFAYDWKLGRRA
jgi:Sulfotransferase family